jgi:hypothetical protein
MTVGVSLPKIRSRIMKRSPNPEEQCTAAELEAYGMESEMKVFVWITTSGAWLLSAKDSDNAYDQIIKKRIKTGQNKKEAEAWFDKDDQMCEIDGYFGPDACTIVNWLTDRNMGS